MKTKVYPSIKKNIDHFNKTELKFNPVYAKTQPRVTELIDYYWSDRFRDGDFDRSGWKKHFYNIIQSPTMVAAKQVDLDTKDVRVTAEQGQSYYPAWLFGKELNLWMKNKGFGSTLNNFVFNNPKYGSTVFKHVKQDVKIVPIQNIKFDPEEPKLDRGKYVIEEHEDTIEVLKKKGEGWDEKAVKEAISKAKDGKVKYYEHVGHIEGMTSNYVICDEYNNVFYDAKIDINDLYRKHDWEEIPGCGLGRGQVQRLFEAQMHRNKVTHYKTRGLHWTSKHIWQTADTTFRKNLSTGTDDGDVLTVQSKLEPVQMEERNLHAYREEEQTNDVLADKLTFAYDVVRGERTPAGTPLGSAILQTQQAGGFFDQKREDIGLFLKDLIFDWVIPSFKETSSKEHVIMLGEFSGQELDNLRRALAVHRGNKAVMDYIIRNGIRAATPEKVELIKKVENETVRRQKELTIPSSYYKNLKYKIDVLITSEQIDVASKLATLQSVLSMIANPAFMNDPRAKSIFYQILDLVGISPVNFEEPEESLTQTVGSIPKFSAPAGATPITRTATV